MKPILKSLESQGGVKHIHVFSFLNDFTFWHFQTLKKISLRVLVSKFSDKGSTSSGKSHPVTVTVSHHSFSMHPAFLQSKRVYEMPQKGQQSSVSSDESFCQAFSGESSR
jgi:hypothetical protein